MFKDKSQTERNIYFSQNTDWVNKDNITIAVWAGMKVDDDEHEDFKKFVSENLGKDITVEPIGNLKGVEYTSFVFLIKTSVRKFAVKRFLFQGMRWWFDLFSEMNGGHEVHEESFREIIGKLGLVVNENVERDCEEDDE